MEQQLVNWLSTLADEQRLVERAMDGYKRTIKRDPTCLPPHIQPEDVQGVLRTHSLSFKNARLSYPSIDTSLELVVRGEIIGYYRLITLLAGTVDDDYFVLTD